jgi:hypothetical protein
MRNLRQVLKQLRGERSRTQKELSRFDDAIAAFEKLAGNNPGPGRPRKPRRTLSAAARRRISRAQKARWAKVRREKAAKG